MSSASELTPPTPDPSRDGAAAEASWELHYFEQGSSLPGSEPDARSEVFPLSRQHPNIIGRVLDATIVIRDPHIARHHFRLDWAPAAQAFLLTNNLNVRTPASVNGRLLLHAETCPLRDGDELQVGLARLCLRLRG